MKKNSSTDVLKLCLGLVILLALAVPFASSTSLNHTDVSGQVLGPGAVPAGLSSIPVARFEFIDGGDSVISESLDVGEDLHSFENNSTMFLNQTASGKQGLNGFNDGEDILNVSVVHVEGEMEEISGEILGNFSSNVYFADGGNKSDGTFNGDEFAGNESEAIIVDNTSSDNYMLDSGDFVMAEGALNFSNFSEDVMFSNSTASDFFDGSQALIRSQTDSRGFLNSSDEVILPGKAALSGFDSQVRFADPDDDDLYEEGNAIVNESGGDDDGIFEPGDEVIVSGDVDMVNAAEVWISYFNSTPGDFQNEDEPIYYEGSENYDQLVNVSDIRIGSVEVEVNQGLELMSNDTLWNASLEIGKELYNVTESNTGYDGNGSFKVLEYDNTTEADGAWNPGNSGDQDVLIYDPSDDLGTSISGETDIPDIYVYDSHPNRDTIPNSMEPGDRFNDSLAGDVNTSYTSYEPEVNLTFDGSDSTYDPREDNVTLNVSLGGESGVVILAPDQNSGELGYEGQLHKGGYIRFWNTSGDYGLDPEDGIYADMDTDGMVTAGDVRLGGWMKNKSAGEVKEGDIDIGINLTELPQDTDVKVVDADHDDEYDPGSGKASDSDGREALLLSGDDELGPSDEIVRSGDIDTNEFGTEHRFTDFDQDGSFEGPNAIIKNNDGGEIDLLEDSDDILKSGNASLQNISEEVRYVENGTQPGFEKGSSEAIVWDSQVDGILSRGPLDQDPDRVLEKGQANLLNFSQPPRAEGETGKVFVDSNSTGRYNQGEDILNITLVTNGSASDKINGSEIRNFADTTKHSNNSFYQDGDAIVNDTDDNSVYGEVFEALEIENVFERENPFYYRNVTSSQMDGGLFLYKDSDSDGNLDSDDTMITEISATSDQESPPYTWEASGLGEEILQDTTYFVSFNSSTGLSDAVFGFRAALNNVETAGSSSLTYFENDDTQLVDSYPPRIVGAWTGTYSSGNNSESMRDKIHISIEENKLLSSDSYESSNFRIFSERYEVIKAESSENYGAGNKNIVLTLNGSLPSNATPKVGLTEEGSIRDNVGNTREDSNVTPKDGLRPLIEDISYLDENVDGTLDMLEVVFSERVNYTSFDASGWEVESRGFPCIQPLAPGNEASFCSTEAGKIDVTSKGDLSLYTEPLGLESMDYVNSSVENSSMYEIGGKLYNVTSSNTGYSSDGGFVVHEYGNSVSSSDGVWNPDSGDQDVLVYSMNGTELTPGNVLIYDENSSNDNVSISAGEEFTRQDIKETTEPDNSYQVDAWTGFTGPGPFDPADNNVSVNVSYNSSDYSEPNSTIVSLAPKEAVPGLGASKTFNEAGNVKFWNTSGSSTDPVADGLFVDVNMTGNISNGDVRLGKWTLPDEEQLYTHEITSEVDSQTAGSSLNNTLLNLSTGNYSSLNVEDIRSAEIHNETRELNITGNITSLDLSDNGATLNVSFNTSKYDINLSDSDEVSVSYYSESDITFNHLDTVELNSMSARGVYDGLGSLDQMNTSVVEINATALPDVTGTSGNEPVMNFTVLENLVTDQSGNTLTNTSESVTLTDRAAPAVTSASTQDADNDARIDRLELEFSENLDNASSSYGSAFNTSNGTIDAVWNRNTGDSLLTLNVSEVGGTAFTPNLTVYTDSVYDASGNALNDNQSFDKVTDSANPLLMNAEIDPALSNSDFTFVDMEFSENVSGDLETDENMDLDGQTVSFNYTDSSRNLSVNYSQVLQTGDSPNITTVSGLADDSGNSLEKLHESNVTVNTFRRQMVEGWNFVSFPIASKNTPNISEVVDISNVDVVWTRMNDSWATYDPDAPVNDFDHVRGGKGYYLKASENFTLTPNVENKVEGSVTDDELDEYGTNLTNGWNLIGNTQEFNQEPGDQTAFVNVDARVDPIYGQKYGNGSKILEVDNPVKESDENINRDLEVGEAYWADIPNGENQTYRAPIGE